MEWTVSWAVHEPQCTLKQGSATKPNTEAPTSKFATNKPRGKCRYKEAKALQEGQGATEKEAGEFTTRGERTAGDQPRLLWKWLWDSVGSSYFSFNYHLCPLSPETSQRRHGWLARRQRQPSNHFNGNGRYSIVIQRCYQVSFGCYSLVWHCSISGMFTMVSMETSFKRIIYLHQTCMYAYK